MAGLLVARRINSRCLASDFGAFLRESSAREDPEILAHPIVRSGDLRLDLASVEQRDEPE